ncbi:MAG: hypothetical protein MJ197_06440 [Bacteroidales bacterium]|nr:hypothetical protein [Bacteroidales bacterium]
MKKIFGLLIIASLAIFATSCGKKKTSVSLQKYADTANYFARKIADIEAHQDMEDIELFLQIQDSTAALKKQADEVLEKLFAENKDTVFLPFEQTKNEEKIKILSVWITDIKYDKVMIAARVEAMDNNTFMGPHAGLVVKDKQREEHDFGGGIQGPTDDKLAVGNVYTFTGQIEHLHLLSDFKSLVFNEEIKKW